MRPAGGHDLGDVETSKPEGGGGGTMTKSGAFRGIIPPGEDG